MTTQQKLNGITGAVAIALVTLIVILSFGGCAPKGFAINDARTYGATQECKLPVMDQRVHVRECREYPHADIPHTACIVGFATPDRGECLMLIATLDCAAGVWMPIEVRCERDIPNWREVLL
jgi:hypothetical protein